jgi:hypothetical protein
MTLLSLANWERFQHYKDRDPPWVKLYRDLLTSESWVLGTDLSRVVQVASIMLAPRYSNKIPMRFDLLRKVMHLDCTEEEFLEAVNHLVSTDFLEIQQDAQPNEPLEHSASTQLATCTSEKIRSDQIRSEHIDARATVPRGTNYDEDHIHHLEWEGLIALYPPGAGRSDLIGAERAARRLVENDEATWLALREGVLRYAKHCAATNRMVLNPVKFFTDADKPWSQPWPIPAKAQSQTDSNISSAAVFLRQGTGS